MSTLEWNKDWGVPEDHDFLEREELAGFRVGDRVEFVTDGDEDEGDFWYAGDEGVVVGFSHKPLGIWNDWARDQVVVGREGMTTLDHVDTDGLEKL